MPGTRSRKGCEECRRRRRKCDEKRPTCGSCLAFHRECSYQLKVVWGGRRFDKSCFGECLEVAEAPSAERLDSQNGGFIYTTRPRVEAPEEPSLTVPYSLPNGISLPPRYRRLLQYFAEDILASLSCHPEVYQDFRRGLLPAALHSPQLLSSCLALSAAGLCSRGLVEVDGMAIGQVLDHLRSSGLPLLRNALLTEAVDDVLLATCLIWCLADVFAYRQGLTSWKVHLEGIKAMLDDGRAFETGSRGTGTAMRHLYQLYLSLRTLPFTPSVPTEEDRSSRDDVFNVSTDSTTIDGFLGYSRDLLHLLRQVDQLARHNGHTMTEADMLLGELKGMIRRDAKTPPGVTLSCSLSSDYRQEYALCHRIFQQASLIHLYRRLYYMSSGSSSIRNAVAAIEDMLGCLSQGEPCHAWVAIAMPLFTIGCEAFTGEQRGFVDDMVDKLEACIGSLHVKTMRQALQDIWRAREAHGDSEGCLCAHQLLGELRYNIILF